MLSRERIIDIKLSSGILKQKQIAIQSGTEIMTML